MTIYIFGQYLKEQQDYDYYVKLTTALDNHGIEYLVHKLLFKEVLKWNNETPISKSFENWSPEFVRPQNILITLGGDGTILKACTLMKNNCIPILGINLGRMGFLASVEKKIIEKAVALLVSGDFTLDNRSQIKVSCERTLFQDHPFALNDFTVHKRDTSSMITIHAYLDGKTMNSYWADGIIISTPTGSTGYSLSCGGPIIFPQSNNFVITPVAPHNLNVRPVVIPDSSEITLKVEGRTDNYMCTLDSRYETITSDYTINIKKGEFPIQFVQLQNKSFIKTLSEKLLWGIDKRN